MAGPGSGLRHGASSAKAQIYGLDVPFMLVSRSFPVPSLLPCLTEDCDGGRQPDGGPDCKELISGLLLLHAADPGRVKEGARDPVHTAGPSSIC